MTPLLKYQETLAAAVLSGHRAPALPLFQGSEGRRRLGLAVYANNLMHALVSALRDTFPAVSAIVGEAAFTSLAVAYVRENPPARGALLIWYGALFPAYLDRLDVGALRYLTDLARLECAWLEAYHAAEAEPLAMARLATLAPEQLVAARLRFHPSVRLLRSAHDIEMIWRRYRKGLVATDAEVCLDRATSLAILRPSTEILVLPVSPPVFDCLDRLRDGAVFGEASSHLDQPEHLAELQALIAAGLFIDIETEL